MVLNSDIPNTHEYYSKHLRKIAQLASTVRDDIMPFRDIIGEERYRIISGNIFEISTLSSCMFVEMYEHSKAKNDTETS